MYRVFGSDLGLKLHTDQIWSEKTSGQTGWSGYDPYPISPNFYPDNRLGFEFKFSSRVSFSRSTRGPIRQLFSVATWCVKEISEYIDGCFCSSWGSLPRFNHYMLSTWLENMWREIHADLIHLLLVQYIIIIINLGGGKPSLCSWNFINIFRLFCGQNSSYVHVILLW